MSFRTAFVLRYRRRRIDQSYRKLAVGHSSINVSLTYLRGLEIAELKEEDMPMV